MFPKHFKYNNCLEDVLSTYLIHYGYEHEWLYLYKWNFIYLPLKKYLETPLGSRIDSGWNSSWNAIKNVYNFKMNTYLNPSLKTFYSEHNDDFFTPLILNIDTYDACWSKAYKKYHLQHFCIIIEKSDCDIKILDPYYTDKILRVNSHSIENCNYRIITLERDATTTVMPSSEQIIQIIKNEFNKKQYNGSNTIESIRTFAQDFILYFDYKKDYLNMGKGFSPLCIQLENIAFSRKNLSLLLQKYVFNKELNFMHKEFEQLYVLWRQLLEDICSGYINENILKSQIGKKLENIACIEDNLYKKILEYTEWK